jgi:hypothetical protein
MHKLFKGDFNDARSNNLQRPINREVDEYVIIEKGTDRYPEVLAHVACEQKRAATGLGLDEWMRKLRWPKRS